MAITINEAPNEEDFYQIHEQIAQAPRPRPHERSQIVDFYAGRSVLITGASGFIGKVLIEKLLRTCPQIKRIFVLIRPKWSKSPEERLRELLSVPLFEGLRREGVELAERVVVVEGDVTQQNLGLSGQNLLRMSKEVSVIFHSAATVKFDEPLKQSIGINIAGTKNMIEFCRRCPKLAGLVHVSTAYANCNRAQVEEHIYPVNNMDPEKLIQMADWLDLDTMQELKRRLLEDRPNTYTYTKALAEWLIVKCARDLPVVICRPSIVVASESEPFKGWIDNVNGPTGVILGCGKGLIRSMLAQNQFVADLVPVDKVINMIVTLGWFAHINKNQKHLNSDLNSADSFTESLLSGGPSSAASTSGGDVESLESHSTSTLNEAAAKLLRNNKATPEVKEESEKEQQQNGTHRKQRASNSSSSISTPSLSDDDSVHEEESKPQQQQQQPQSTTRQDDLNYITQHHHHLNHHHNDDGYGSRSSDYANSISSSDNLSSNGNNNNNNKRKNRQRNSLAKTTTTTTTILSDTTNHNIKLEVELVNNNNNNNSNNELEQKLKRFRQRTRAKLLESDLPEELADVPVFHCTSGGENSITWGRVQFLIVTALCIFPSISTYRYPTGSFTNKRFLDDLYRWTLHYIPGYIADFITRLMGGKPVIVRIFNKFDQAASVLRAFTMKEWEFKYQNRLFLMEELLSDEDKRLFSCDMSRLDWNQFAADYVLGVRKFLLKEPMNTLEQARSNLKYVYYRNLSLQVLVFATFTYYLLTSSWFPSLSSWPTYSPNFATHLEPSGHAASGTLDSPY